MKQLFNRQIELRLKHGPSIWFPKAKYVKCRCYACYACRCFSLADNLSQARRVPIFSLFEGPLCLKKEYFLMLCSFLVFCFTCFYANISLNRDNLAYMFCLFVLYESG